MLKMVKKLNLGCGRDYCEGWINADFNKEVKADMYLDLTQPLPFKDNEIDEILLDNVLEHIQRDRFLEFVDELWRITKPKGLINIYVPHFTGLTAFKHPTHYTYFGICTFGFMEATEKPGINFSGERYNKARFNIKERLMVLHHSSQNFGFMNKAVLPLDWFFNAGGHVWKMFWEKFNLFGFEEIRYELEVIK